LLLGNALMRGAPEGPIAAGLAARRQLVLSVVAIGRGLDVAAEIARAHGGTLEPGACEAETRFIFRMPL
jgi:hypothetical protein